MPGPGGGGGGHGGGGHGGGGHRGGHGGGHGGFRGGGPGFGGPGFRGWPGGFRGGPAPPGFFFGRPGFGGPPPGPMGGPWCCWPLLCVIIFLIVASVDIALIQTLSNCSEETDRQGDYTSQSSCFEYEAICAFVVGVVILCCCCFLMRSREGEYQPQDGTPGERQPMLATEAPPPAIVYASAVDAPPKPAATEYETTVKVYGRA